jgi:hypothetical protein
MVLTGINPMKYFKNISMTVVGLVLLSLTLTDNVYAYLDPGTGSYFLQLTLAALLGSLYAIKVYWKKIRSFFKNIFSKRK